MDVRGIASGRLRKGDLVVRRVTRAEECTTTIGSDGSGPLAQTGVDSDLLLPLTLIAIVLLVAGVVVFVRSRRTVATGAVVAAVIVAATVSAAGMPTPAAARAADPGCSLIRIDSVQIANPTGLLPGDSAVGLRYRVTNVAAFPIDVAVDTTLPEGRDPVAADVQATVTAGGTVLGDDVFDESSGGDSLRLQPGDSLDIGYLLSLSTTAGNTAQSHTLFYDSTVSATQR